MADIRIRIVPKSKTDVPQDRSNFNFSSSDAKDLMPDQHVAKECHRRVAELNVDAKLTPKNGIHVTVNPDQAAEIFGVYGEYTSRTLSDVVTGSKEVFAVRESVKLPDSLSNLAAFAYVPQPVDFFAPSFVPPNASVYHLRVADVVRAVGAAKCHRRGWTGSGIRIAMADTGFARHTYFDAHDFNITRVSTPQTTDPGIDTNGHGTGESANALAVAPDCEFIGIKHDDYSAMALETSLAQNPHIMTHSWGWNIDSFDKPTLQQQDPNTYFELLDVEQIILDAIDDGVVTVFAGGNGQRAFPGSIPEVMSIGGVTVQKDGDLEASSYASSFQSQLYPGRRVPDLCGCVGSYKNPGPMPGHIMLPVPQGSELEGDNLPASQSNRGWGIFSGTSAAAPQLAGAAALVLSANPQLTPAQVKQILMDTAQDVTKGVTGHGIAATNGRDDATGAGFVNAFAACLRATQGFV